MIWGISCLQFCKKSADHKEGNTCSEVPIEVYVPAYFSQIVWSALMVKWSNNLYLLWDLQLDSVGYE